MGTNCCHGCDRRVVEVVNGVVNNCHSWCPDYADEVADKAKKKALKRKASVYDRYQSDSKYAQNSAKAKRDKDKRGYRYIYSKK